MTLNRDLPKGSCDSLLLCLLEEKPMYGYELVKELESRSQGYFRFKEGTLYPALHRLENMGVIASKWEQVPNRRPRRYYHITEKGYLRLADESSKWHKFLDAMRLILKPAKSE